MSKLKRMIVLTAVSSALLVLTACGGSKPSTTEATNSPMASDSAKETMAAATKAPADQITETMTLRLKTHYNNENEKTPVDASIAKLKNDFPNVTIQPEGYDNDNGAAFKARIASGDLPDIFELDGTNSKLVIKTNSVIPLDSYIQDLGIKDIMAPSISMDSLKSSDGKTYSIPVYGPTYLTMFYNKELFETNGVKVPTNFDELLEAVKVFNGKGITPIALAGKANFLDGTLFDMFAQRVNPKGFMGLQDGSVKIQDYKEAATKIETLVKMNAFEKGAASIDYDPARAIYHGGKAAMLITGEWEVSEGQKDLGDKLKFFDQFPVMDAGKEYTNPGIMPGGGINQTIAISSKVKNPDFVAKVFAKYYEYYQEAQFTKLSVIWTTTKTEKMTPDNPLPAEVNRYVAAKNNLQSGNNTWLGQSSNQKFDVGFYGEMQNLLSGESADSFLVNVGKLVESTK
jgi:raffinose/stachyose/melibiose transport system substrate-binding protein